jgi:hypothetical protein
VIDISEALKTAETIAPGEPIEWGRFLAIDAELQRKGEPPVSRWMRDTYQAFWRSGATTLCMGVGQRGTKSTTAMRAVLLPEILLSPYTISSGAIPKWPIISANKGEAAERVRNVEHFLKMLDFSELPRTTKTTEKIGLSRGQFVVRAGMTIHLLDGCDNPMDIAVLDRDVGAVSGFTGRGSALCDEMDLWDHGVNEGRVPVTEHILETLAGRGARQGATKLLMVSRLFSPDSALSVRCREGSSADKFVATLGEHGARLDLRARRWLAKYYEREARRSDVAATKRSLYSDLAADPRLHEDPDPRAYAIPGWAAFADGPDRDDCPPRVDGEERPENAIAECRRLAGASIRNERDILDGLFRAYGSRGYASGTHAFLDRLMVEACASPERLLEARE